MLIIFATFARKTLFDTFETNFAFRESKSDKIFKSMYPNNSLIEIRKYDQKLNRKLLRKNVIIMNIIGEKDEMIRLTESLLLLILYL